jgi:phenylalanyl-tRNA synthetase alpha chain
MNAARILEGLSHQEKKVLLSLQDLSGSATPEQLFEKGDFEQLVEVMNAASWLQSKGLVRIEEQAFKQYAINNREVMVDGLPERQALREISEAGGRVTLAELEEALGKETSGLAVGWLKRKALATIEKGLEGPTITMTDTGQSYLYSNMKDEFLLELLAGKELMENEIPEELRPFIVQLKSRQNMIIEKQLVRRKLHLTDLGREALALGIELTEEVAQLTPELIQSGKWRTANFRKYDVNTFAPVSYAAKKHLLTRMADEVRRIFVQMGFTEIDDEYVQPSFWNMDALFTPQDHPAREMQDTFYLKNPSSICLDKDIDILNKVKQVHETGGDSGSLGWRYQWSRQEAERALLRTHTTVNTLRYLAQHKESPVKVFSLSRVFRKEAIDATHLPEFAQIEGILMEEGASFDMLVGVLREFYGRMGFEDIRVRPGYFPYTEPSLEVEVLWNDKWLELGGAGVFRPEVTAPFGIEHPVLAWGQGFERLAMLHWNLKDIRELYQTDMDLLRQSPIF